MPTTHRLSPGRPLPRRRPRVSALGRLLVAGLLAAVLGLFGSLSAPTAASAATAHPQTASANCPSGISAADCNAAAYVYNFATSHNYSPPSGYTGNSVYRNDTGLLPAGGNYREYDIYNVSPRASERLVIDKDNPEGNSWFTPDHYGSFVQFYLLA